MRGEEARQPSFVFMGPLEARIPADHPLRAIRTMTDQALSALSPLFAEIYAERAGPPSRPSTSCASSSAGALRHPLRTQALRAPGVSLALSLVRGSRSAEPVWHPTTFTQNRERLLAGEVAEAFFGEVKKQAEAQKLLSRSTSAATAPSWRRPLPSRASAKRGGRRGSSGGGPDDDGPDSNQSFRGLNSPRDRNPAVDFRGERRSNQTHASTPIPRPACQTLPGEARAPRLCRALLTENRTA